MQNPISELLCWFDKKFNTKDSLQALVIMAFLLLIIITKCYMMISPDKGFTY